jgi:Protein kinase domain
VGRRRNTSTKRVTEAYYQAWLVKQGDPAALLQAQKAAVDQARRAGHIAAAAAQKANGAQKAAVDQARRARETQERAVREQHVQSEVDRADRETRIVEQKVQWIEDLLAVGVHAARPLDLRSSVSSPPRPEFSLGRIAIPDNVPQVESFLPRDLGFIGALLPGAKQRHAVQVAQAQTKHAAALHQYEVQEAARQAQYRDAQERHQLKVRQWDVQLAQRRSEAETLQVKLLKGDADAVESAVRIVLEQSRYPVEHKKKFTYAEARKALTIEYELMGPAIVPEVTGYTYVRSKDEVKSRSRTEAQRKAVYNTYIAGVALRTIYELFTALPITILKRVDFNGYVMSTDMARGGVAKYFLVSVSVTEGDLKQVDLSQVDPVQCIVGLAGRISRNSVGLISVDLVGMETDRITTQTKTTHRTKSTSIQLGNADIIDARYKIVASLGRGAFGTVYHVRDQQLQRDVALKVLHTHLADEAEDRRRFIHEARALARVSNPYIVHVYDINDKARPPYFTMEFIPGTSLAKALESHIGLPLPRLLDITRKLCEAVDCIHQANLVHRDIKADNVILTPQGEPRLLDFGIALAEGQTRLTGVGYGLGTPESAAPEQVGGGDVTKAADIYALGILVFYMATGRQPFEGDVSHVLYAQVHEAPPALQDRRTDVSQHLAAAVRAALSKRPEDRPVSAGSFWRMAASGRP